MTSCGCRSSRNKCLPIGSVTKTCTKLPSSSCCMNPVVTAIDSFSIPECDTAIYVTFDCALTLPPGIFLYNPDYGFLKVETVNISESGTNTVLSLKNNCMCSPVAAGVMVPAYTTFILTDNEPPLYCTYSPVPTIDEGSSIIPNSTVVADYFTYGDRVHVDAQFTATIGGDGDGVLITVPLPITAEYALLTVGVGQFFLESGGPFTLQARTDVTRDNVELRLYNVGSFPTGDVTFDFQIDYRKEIPS